MRLEESVAMEQSEQASEAWMWTLKVVEPTLIELQCIKISYKAS